MYLPIYPPYFNLIENLSSHWKDIVSRSNCTTEDDSINKIKNAVFDIRRSHFNIYGINMLRFLPKCLNKEKTIDG